MAYLRLFTLDEWMIPVRPSLGPVSHVPLVLQRPKDREDRRVCQLVRQPLAHVENAAGALVGHDTIRRVTDCFLHESYTTPSGYEGQSFNIFDAARGVWHQSWVDNGGLLLQLDGGLDGGKMILQGPGVGQGGAAVINRITWSVEGGDPDHVRQLWETSADDGKTWSVGFDGHYMREAEKN